MSTKPPYQTYLKYSGIGIELALSGVIPLLLGIYADKYFESSPWGLLSGLAFGILGLGVNLYKVVIQLNQKQNPPHGRA